MICELTRLHMPTNAASSVRSAANASTVLVLSLRTERRTVEKDPTVAAIQIVKRANLQRHENSFHTTEGQQRQKKSEQAMADALQDAGIAFKREHRTSFDCLSDTWASTDFLVSVKGGIVDVENDEHQHDGYAVACEMARMLKIFTCRQIEGNTLPLVFIRFNPDAFEIDGQTVRGIPKAIRRSALVKVLQGLDLTGGHPLQVLYMYYNGMTTEGKVTACVTHNHEFDQNLAALTRSYYPGLEAI